VDVDAIAGVMAASLAVLAGLVAFVREVTARRSRRSKILQELEILNAMPATSSMVEALQHHVDQAIRRLIKDDETSRRDWNGIVLASLFLVGATWSGSEAIDGQWLLWPVTVFLVVFGTVGLSSDFPKAPRDERGRRLKPETVDTPL
jgi:hypothetical protein|tara:strand:+ start:1293 stop:1733 length:441 start_codon:yes stop_codon:yes gene_type:complete